MPKLHDSLSLTFEPAWPWSIPGLGMPLLATVAVLLVMLTVWTYRGTRGGTVRRTAVLIALRLAALAVACLTVVRPSVALREELRLPSLLLIAVDYSASMTIQDQHNSQSRWEYLCRILNECEPQLRQLRDEHTVTVQLYRFAGDVSEFDPNGRADGKRTDFGEMLHTLYERHGNERFLRGLLVLSDGADNGTRYPAVTLAGRWRTLPCPIHTFAFGQTTTTSEQHDIALTDIIPDPPTVATKGKLTIRGKVNAPGFVGATAHVRLFINDKEVGAARDEKLTRQEGNEVQLTCDAPPEPGEIKVTLKIDSLPGETTSANNEISTYVTVTKEGISVLYVEGKERAWEPTFIRRALSQEPSISLHEAVRRTDEPPPPGQEDWYELGRQHYDVIILGDITARRLSAGDPHVLETINKMVFEKGTGLMMIGGTESLGESDWADTPIAKLLPVELDPHGQVNGRIQMVPTPQGLRHYVMRLAEREEDNAELWKAQAGRPEKAQVGRLDGMNRLGAPKLGAFVLAESSQHEPILVGQMNYGNGRTLAFAGDTTWMWIRDAATKQLHDRFWKQVVFWLAKRDEANGNVAVTPRTRRLAAGDKLDFGVKLRGKGGVLIQKDAHFEVKVIGPQGTETAVPTAREGTEERGTFWKTDAPGEYVIRARGWGTDVDGQPLKDLPPSDVRFMVYQDDSEMARQAADHLFLTNLANAGGGKFHQAEELKQFLKELSSAPLPQSRQKAKLWPDWRRSPPSRAARDQAVSLASSGILGCFLLFVGLLCLEWFLRRYWGLV
jgi:uncharacterized membrane protein